MVALVSQDLTEPVRLHLDTSQHVSRLATRDEYCTDFDHCMVIYSDRMGCESAELAQISRLTSLMLGQTTGAQQDEGASTGGTTVGCYQGDRFVGSINFYSDAEKHPQSNVDVDGRVHLWFPLPCFPHILGILLRERRLSLSLIQSDLAGKSLVHPVGALLTWPGPTGREEEEVSC